MIELYSNRECENRQIDAIVKQLKVLGTVDYKWLFISNAWSNEILAKRVVYTQMVNLLIIHY